MSRWDDLIESYEAALELGHKAADLEDVVKIRELRALHNAEVLALTKQLEEKEEWWRNVWKRGER